MSAPATGVSAAAVSQRLRFKVGMFDAPLSRRSGPRGGVAGGGDVPAQHHRVVFVDDVVAVHRIPSQEVPEAEEEQHVAARDQAHDVLAREVHARGWIRGAERAAADTVAKEPGGSAQDLELIEVDVDGNHPTKTPSEFTLYYRL